MFDQLQHHVLPRISVVLHSLAMLIWPACILVNAIESSINKHASLTSSVMVSVSMSEVSIPAPVDCAFDTH